MTHRLAVFTAVLVLTVGCGQAGLPELPPDPRQAKPAPPSPAREEVRPAPTLTAERRDLMRAMESARQRWHATSPRAYRVVVSRECFCDAGIPFESEVEGGDVITAAGGVRSFGRAAEPELRTVETLFAEAERLIRSNAEDVKVSFDIQFGYPSLIVVDRWRDAIDDEWTWRGRLSLAE